MQFQTFPIHSLKANKTIVSSMSERQLELAPKQNMNQKFQCLILSINNIMEYRVFFRPNKD